MASMPFITRLIITCCNWIRSPRIIGAAGPNSVRKAKVTRNARCPLLAVKQTFASNSGRSPLTQCMDRLRFAREIVRRKLEVADMYPACLIGSRAVALMGIRTHLWSH
jgi:hypothetical protein